MRRDTTKREIIIPLRKPLLFSDVPKNVTPDEWVALLMKALRGD